MMGRYALFSALFHLAVIAVAAVGFGISKKEVDIQQPLPVELVETIEEKSKSPDPRPVKKVVKEAPKETPKTSSPQSEPEEEKAPEPEVPEVSPKVEPKKKAPKEEIKPEAIKPVPAPRAKPKPPIKKKPKPKKKKKKKDFSSLLKNLSKQQLKGPKSGTGGAKGDRITASELDRVRKQIERAWRLPAGIKDVHKLKVTITIYMNPNRTVREARVNNPSALSDPSYRILAESALRAVNTFKHKPLLLPPTKYKVWKEITMGFDPSHIL